MRDCQHYRTLTIVANEGESVVGGGSDTPDHVEGAAPLAAVDEWPDYFPESCPPNDASPAKGSFYRIVDEDPPDGEDFLGNLRLQQLGLRFKNRKKRWSDECLAVGVSILADRDEALRLRESVGPMRDKAIAYGDITGDGLLKHTPNDPDQLSHHTWWIPISVEAHEYFRVT